MKTKTTLDFKRGFRDERGRMVRESRCGRYRTVYRGEYCGLPPTFFAQWLDAGVMWENISRHGTLSRAQNACQRHINTA